MLALSSGTLVLCIALAVAIWKVATGIQWALVILASGSAVQMACVGAGIYRRHTLAGLAQLEDARGRARASEIVAQARLRAARYLHPGTVNALDI